MKYTVYIIIHISTGMVLYVGKTRNFKKRAYEHLSLNAHSKKWLSVIGTGNVLIEEVAKFDNETDALKYEDELILKYGTITNGYNERRSGLITENEKEYLQKWFQTHRKGNKEWNKKNNVNQKKYLQRLKEKGEIDAYKEYQKNYQKEYRNTEEHKKHNREYQKEYKKTDKYKEYKREYYKSKKLGISVAEYRKLKKDQCDTLEQNKKQPIQLTINF